MIKFDHSQERENVVNQPLRERRRRITISDVAEAAGVGTATVERVLNERGMVSPATAERVVQTARRLEMHRALPNPHQPLRRVEVLLSESESLFFKRLERAFLQARGTVGPNLVVHRTFIPENDVSAFARRIEAAAASRHGLIVYTPDKPEIARALENVVQAAIPVVTLMTPVTTEKPLPYVGTDQYAAGRMAAYLLGRAVTSEDPVVVVAGRLSVRAHAQRLAGFRDVLAERFPDLEIATVIEGGDDIEHTRALLNDYLASHRDIAGIYNTAATDRTIGDVVHAAGLAGRVPYIGHELTPDTITLLREGVMTFTIDQHPELHALRAFQALAHELGAADTPPDTSPIPLSIVTPENLPGTADLA